MKIEFYNVKKKVRVSIEKDKITKHAYEKVSKNGNLFVRYALKAVDEDGTKLSKFCSKADYENI